MNARISKGGNVAVTLPDGTDLLLLSEDLEPLVDLLARIMPRWAVMTAPKRDRLVVDLVDAVAGEVGT